MIVKLRETMYMQVGETTYVVPHGSCAVLKDNLYRFPDVTKNHYLACTKEFVLATPILFEVKRTLEDRQVSVKDVTTLLESLGLHASVVEHVKNKL